MGRVYRRLGAVERPGRRLGASRAVLRLATGETAGLAHDGAPRRVRRRQRLVCARRARGVAATP